MCVLFRVLPRERAEAEEMIDAMLGGAVRNDRCGAFSDTQLSGMDLQAVRTSPVSSVVTPLAISTE